MSIERSITGGLGPITSPLGTPVSTKPLTVAGIANNTVGTTGEEVLQATDRKNRRVKIVNPVSGTFLGWTVVDRGATAPTTMTAVGDGTATDGSLIPGGSSEWFTLHANKRLYLAGDGAGTVYQLTVVEDA